MAEAEFPYEIVSHWRVPGPIGDVYAVLSDGDRLPRWWPQVYRRVREIAKGDAGGVGRIADITTRGALPYDVKWRLETTEADPPRMMRVKASGDLRGCGEWLLAEVGGDVLLTYTWRVAVEKEWMRRLEFILKPLFIANHRWVMRQGERGLKRELARRARA